MWYAERGSGTRSKAEHVSESGSRERERGGGGIRDIPRDNLKASLASTVHSPDVIPSYFTSSPTTVMVVVMVVVVVNGCD